MKKNNNNKNNIITIWKNLRSEQGKKYSFFIFYIIFFLILFIMIISNKNTSIEPKEEYSLPFSTRIIENNNYKFKYTIDSNLDKLLYKGEKINKTIYLDDDTGRYEFNYINGKLVNNQDIKFLYKEFLDIYEIKKIIKSSKLISETKLNETNEYIYNYKIKNKDLDEILLNNIDNIDLENEINIKTNDKKEIKEIDIDLSNYQRNEELDSFKIIIEYEDINE